MNDDELRAAIAAELHDIFGSRFYCHHELDIGYKRCEKAADRVLAAIARASKERAS